MVPRNSVGPSLSQNAAPISCDNSRRRNCSLQVGRHLRVSPLIRRHRAPLSVSVNTRIAWYSNVFIFLIFPSRLVMVHTLHGRRDRMRGQFFFSISLSNLMFSFFLVPKRAPAWWFIFRPIRCESNETIFILFFGGIKI